MGIQTEGGRIDYFETDVVQSEKGVQTVGRFLGQIRDISGRYDSICQLDQKMKKIIVMTVFHIVKTVMIAMDCRHVLNVCSDQQGYIRAGRYVSHSLTRCVRPGQAWTFSRGKYKTVFLHKVPSLSYLPDVEEDFRGDERENGVGQTEKSGNTRYYRFM